MASENDFGEEALNSISGEVLGCAIKVAKKLRPGFLEKVYENALFHELGKSNLRVARQVHLNVDYDGISVGTYIADIVVENRIILELKATDAISEAHMAQALNYLSVTGCQLCLILNFGTDKLGIKRIRN